MAGVRTSINLIDGFSNTFERFLGGARKIEESINKTQDAMNQNADFATKMSHTEQKLELPIKRTSN